jgi:hypothetical protein
MFNFQDLSINARSNPFPKAEIFPDPERSCYGGKTGDPDTCIPAAG